MSRLLQQRERGPERQAQVGSRIAVGDREYVDAIEEILLAYDAVYARYERIGQRIAIKMSGHRIGQARCYSRGNRNVVP